MVHNAKLLSKNLYLMKMKILRAMSMAKILVILLMPYSYTGEGHSNSVYTVKIIDSNGNLKELKFNERDYYFLLTDPPQQQPKQQGGKRKYLKQKNITRKQ
jgi:hypothetical protein